MIQKSVGAHYYKANSERNKSIKEWQADTLLRIYYFLNPSPKPIGEGFGFVIFIDLCEL